MINSSVYKRLLLAFGVIFFIACDRDFNEIDTNIIEDDIHHDNMTRMVSDVVAFDRPTGPVQANNLPVNSLGIFNDPAFGTTTAHFVTQVRLDPGNPTFTTNVNIERVYLYVPYESRLISTNAEGIGTYELDSIYGNPDAAMRLNIYENKFFLRDSDPGTTFLSGQRYYSNDFDLIHDNRNPVRLNDNSNTAQNDQFKIRNTQIDRSEPTEEGGDDTEIVERLAPGIFADLNKDFFKSKIINAPAGKLVNQSVFKEWFRGIYFNIEDIGNGGAMASMNFKRGKIVIKYYQDEEAGTEGTPSADRVKKTLTLDMNPGNNNSITLNTVNLFKNTYNSDYLDAINASDNDISGQGDTRLYLKGGEGSMAFIHLPEDEILGLRESNNGGKKVLINEANLTFHVDQALMGGSKRPLRVYLYDVVNKRPLYDYYTDVTSSSTDSKRNKAVHGGLVGLNKDNDGHQYKIRITNYINTIVQNQDSLPRTLGLVVTENINFVGSAALRNAVETVESETTTALPAASVISRGGVILYGSKPDDPENEDKRVKLEIFYTEPN